MSNITFVRRKKADWEADNPILRDGEPGIELPANLMKVGNGRHEWNRLPYLAAVLTHETQLRLAGAGADDLAAVVSTMQDKATAATDSELASAVALLQDKATAATDSELATAIGIVTAAVNTKQDAATAATDDELAAAVSTLQSAATAATDSELSAAISTVTTALATKQDASTAATDSELAAAVSTLQSAATAATDSELSTAIATVTTALGTKQDAATAATDSELATGLGAVRSEVSVLTLIGTTADATPKTLTVDGAAVDTNSNVLVVAADSVVAFEALVSAKQTGAHDAVGTWKLYGCITRTNTGGIRIVGSVIVNEIGVDDAAAFWVVTAEASASGNYLVLKVTGVAATTISWKAHLITSKVVG